MPTITLVTWNVENLFKPGADATAEQQSTYDAKIPLLGQILAAINADLIALQEVGGDDALQDLQNALGAANYPHRRRGVPDGRGIAVAFLSKLPLQQSEDITAFPPSVRELSVAELDGTPMTRMGRGALRVRVRKSGFTFDAINLHLKSKLLTFPNQNGTSDFSTQDETLRAKVGAHALLRRTAESATVRTVSAALIRGNQNALAVLGDFNDVPEAATTAIFQGPEGSEIGTGGFQQADQGETVRLWNLAPAIAPERRFSRIHRGAGELLDQIFVSEEFLPRGDDNLRQLPQSVDSLIENIQSIGDNPNARSAKTRPDHAPVVAVFDLD